MNGLSILFEHYKDLVERRAMIEAIDLYYHDHIIQYENQNPPLETKALLRTKEQAVSENMISLDVRVYDYRVDEHQGIVTGMMDFRFESRELGKKRLVEQFYQKWQNGKIIEQRFSYDKVLDQN